MTSHPHDCPVCEGGGMPPAGLYDSDDGHNSRRYRSTKRTHQESGSGPFINHEMNRCIACYRCVRYYKDYAGGEDLGGLRRPRQRLLQPGRGWHPESEFSGNLVEVCPTGVFTDKTHPSVTTVSGTCSSPPASASFGRLQHQPG